MDPIKDAVQDIKKMLSSQDEKTQKAISENIEIIEKAKKEVEAKVATLNEDLGKKEATIKEIQDEVKELKAKNGKQQAIQQSRKSLFELVGDKVIEFKQQFEDVTQNKPFAPIELKAVGNISSSNLSGDNYQSYLDWRPGMEPIGTMTHFRDLVRTINSETDFVQFPRANVPIGEGSFGRQVTEGATKPQIDRDYTMISLTLTPMAGYAIVSRQSLRNIIFLREWLPTSMLEQLQDAEDTDFANKLVAAATGSSTTAGTGNAEKFIDLFKNLKVAKFNATGIAVDPAVWAKMLYYRPGTDNGYGMPSVVTVGPDGTVRILGVPIYPVNWLTGGRYIMGNWQKAAIVQSEGLQIRQSESHASTFTSNEVTFLLERTENLAIFRPDAFITGVMTP